MDVAGPPRQITRFIGRDDELRRLLYLLQGNQLVTLLGPPGVGKTRLAIEVAGCVATDDTPSVTFVDLTQIGPGHGVADAVAGAVGLSLQLGESAERAVEKRLSATRLLVILDTCDHVRDQAAALVELLLASCPGVRFLATSRAPLGVSGEVRLKVAPLASRELTDGVDASRPDDAVHLFVDRAQLADPDFALTAENVTQVAEICRHLDGNPLAIELAAALAGALSLADVQNGLRNRFNLLRSHRGGSSRQRSLQAAVEWSYALLSVDEQRAFQRLSVFPTDFSAASAQAVLAGDGLADHQVLSILARLGETSLIERTDRASSRYQMLESLRQFAWLHLTTQPEAGRVMRRAAAEAASREAHRTAVHLLEEALRMSPADASERMPLLDQLALEAEQAGLFQVGVRALEELQAIAADHAADWHGRLMVRLSNLLTLATGDLSAAERAAASAADLFGQAGETTAALSASLQLAWLRGLRGDLPGQAAAAAQIVDDARESGDGEVVMHALGCLGTAQAFLGEVQLARQALTQARRVATDRRTAQLELWADAQLAFVDALEGDLRAAHARLPETVTDELVEPVALEVLVFVYYLAGDYRGVLGLIGAGSTALAGLGVRGGWALAIAAACAAERGESALAEELAERARTLFAERPIYAHYHAHLWMRGVACWCRLDLSEAAGLLEEASHGLLAMGCRPLAALCLYDLCAVLADAGHGEEAAQARRRLTDVATGLSGSLFAALIDDPDTAAGSFARLGLRGLHARALARAGHLEQAARAFEDVGCAWRCERSLAALALQGRAPLSPAAQTLTRAVVFDGVPAATLERLASQAVIATFLPGEVVARRGAPIPLIYVVTSGRLKASVGTSRGEMIGTLLGPGDLVGERGLIDGERQALNLVALEQCRLVGLRREQLLELLADEPAVGERLIMLLRQRLRADARISGEPEPTDIAGDLMQSIQRLTTRVSSAAPVFEILPIYLTHGQVWLLQPHGLASWQVAATADVPPGPFVSGTLDASGLRSEIVHSTSWRYEQDRLVLTYLAIVAPPALLPPAGFEAVPVQRADLARGSARDAPSAIAVAQVVEHGLRHLAWLSKDDPVVGRELSPAWRSAVASYVPEPFRAL
jgi:predicted ATPase/CRP-like cAMP-binding protein